MRTQNVLKIKCYCKICGGYIGLFYPSQLRKTCSRKCKCRITSINNIGNKNPNYKHGKTIENKCHCGKLIDYRAKYCMMCKNKILPNPFSGKHHTEETKIVIGKKSKDKFTKEYLEKIRKVYEERGLWIPKNKLTDYLIYYRKCEWDKEISKAKNFFLVRDHIYSRYDGFINNIHPLILQHPINCQILSRSQNISKRNKSGITLKDLFSKIRRYKGTWTKHEECLKLLREVL